LQVIPMLKLISLIELILSLRVADLLDFYNSVTANIYHQLARCGVLVTCHIAHIAAVVVFCSIFILLFQPHKLCCNSILNARYAFGMFSYIH